MGSRFSKRNAKKEEESQQHQKLYVPWKARIFLAISTFFVDLSCRPDHTLNRTLFNLVDLKIPPNSKHPDITVDPETNLWFRLFLPKKTSYADKDHPTRLPIIIYFHGGGFICMSANSLPYHDLCARLAKELDAIVISVNYRLAPEHKFPAQYDDAWKVLTFLDENGDNILPPNADLRRVFLAGDSAGANIAHHLAVRVSKGYPFKHEINVLGVIALQMFLTGEEMTESEKALVNMPVVNMARTNWSSKAFLPEGADKDHPSLNVLKELREEGFKYPAAIVVVGGFDPLKDRQKLFYNELKRSGKEAYLVEYDNAFHTFYAFPEVPESGLMICELKDFMRKQLQKFD